MSFFQSQRLTEHRQGKQRLEEIERQRAYAIILHYACEAFSNAHGRSSRIASISYYHLHDGQTTSHSISQNAQRRKYDVKSMTEKELDECEKQLLKDFVKKVKEESKAEWIHWKMRNATYGFEALSNRCDVLGVRWKTIHDNTKHDLPAILELVYTKSYEQEKPDGTLVGLCTRNKIPVTDMLRGDKEGLAFRERRFKDIDMSNHRKVEVIAKIYELAASNKLRVRPTKMTIYGANPPGVIEWVKNNWLLAVLVPLAISLALAAYEPIVQAFAGTSGQSGNTPAAKSGADGDTTTTTTQ